MARKHNATGRSRRQLSSFVALERYILNSPAWKSLPLPGRCAYIEICNLYNGSNNGKIALSARTLADLLTISRSTAGRALADLEERGFIETVRQGGFNIKTGVRRSTEWRLTTERCDVTAERPTKKFMRWQDGKIHFTASLQSHAGLTTEPQKHVAQ
jgi:predicted transcriptional regulator of viral defense system